MSDQSSSDPLPYVQIDRAILPKATLLAGHIQVTTQHAIGSLFFWWQSCGDPRELEDIARATPEGEEPAVVLPLQEIARRFELASGKTIDPAVLVSLGLVEHVDNERARVRGMSRFFGPVVSRINARSAASAGGKASAEARKQRLGTANPRANGRSRASSQLASRLASQPASHVGSQRVKRMGSGDEAGVNPSGQRSAVNVQLLEATTLSIPSKSTEPTDIQPSDGGSPNPPLTLVGQDSRTRELRPNGGSPGVSRKKTSPPPDPRHSPLVKALTDEAQLHDPGWRFTGRAAKSVTELLALGEPAEVLERWRRAWARADFPKTRTLPELVENWGHFGATVVVGFTQDVRKGMVRAEDQVKLYGDKVGLLEPGEF